MKLIQGQDWQSKFPRQWLGAPPNGKAGSPLGTPSLRPFPGRPGWGFTVGPQASI